MANDSIVDQAAFWNPWRIIGWIIPVILLITPAVAMRYTSEVDWSGSDFVIMGAIFTTVGLGIEFLVRQSRDMAYRLGAVVASVTAFLTVWVNLAVGMIGDDNPYNLLFGGVLFVALIGSIIANFKAAGMSRTMAGTAVLQGLVAAGGIATDLRGAIFSVAFALPWLLAAGLFRRAALVRE